MLILDTANILGSRPDGWWRDRAGATERLIEQVAAAIVAGRLVPPVVAVLEGRARAASGAGATDGLLLVRASASGDEAVVEVAAAALGKGSAVTVVTADRELTQRVRRLGAAVEPPGELLDGLAPVRPPGQVRPRGAVPPGGGA